MASITSGCVRMSVKAGLLWVRHVRTLTLRSVQLRRLLNSFRDCEFVTVALFKLSTNAVTAAKGLPSSIMPSSQGGEGVVLMEKMTKVGRLHDDKEEEGVKTTKNWMT